MKKKPLSIGATTDGRSGVLMMILVNILIGVRYFTTGLLEVYHANAILPLVEIAFSCCLIVLLAHYFYPKLAYFSGCTTTGDIIERVYGKTSRDITSFITAFCCFLMVAAPLAALGSVAEVVDFSRLMVILIFGALVVGYSILTERNTLSFLGLIKFVSLVIGITYLLGQVLSYYNGNVLSLREAVTHIAERLKTADQKPRFTPFTHDGINSLLSAFFWIGWPALLLSPPVIQQLLANRSTATTKQGVTYFGMLYSLLKLILLGIALFVFVRLKGTSVEQKGAFFYLLAECLSGGTPLVYQVLVLLMYCASLLGTAYLFLKALVVIIADHIASNRPAKATGKSRLITLLICLIAGLLATLCAYLAENTAPTTLVGITIGLLGALTIPLFAGVMGLAGHKKMFLYSVGTFLVTGLVGVTFCYFKEDWLKKALAWIGTTSPGFPDTCYYLLPLVAELSVIIFFYLHHEHYGRLKYLKRRPLSPVGRRTKGQSTWITRFYAPLDWATTQLRYYGKAPELLGVVFVIGYLAWGTPWHHGKADKQVQRYITLLNIGRMCGIMLATGLIVRPVWPVQYKRLFPLYWLLTLWFCIPFTNTLLFLHAPNEQVFFAWCLLSFLLLGVVVDRSTFLLLMGGGILPAWAVYHFGIPFVYRYHRLDVLRLLYSLACLGLILLIRLFFIVDKDLEELKKQRRNVQLTRHFYQQFDEALAAIPIQEFKKVLDQEISIKHEDDGHVIWAFQNQQSYQKLVGYISKYERQRKVCQLKNVVFTKLLLDEPSDRLYRQSLKVTDGLKDLYQQLSPAYQVKVDIKPIDPACTIWVATPFFDYVMQSILYYAVKGRSATNVAISWNSTKQCLSIRDNGAPLPLNRTELFNLENIGYYSHYAFPLVKLVLRKMQAKINVYQDGGNQVFELFFPAPAKPTA